MNSKETLKKLHKTFPLLSLDELFNILDCYVETSPFTPLQDKVYCTAPNGAVSNLAPEKRLINKANYSDEAISNINTTGNIQLAASH